MDGYVPHAPSERQYFDYLWDIANNRAPGNDPSGQGELSGAAAVQFFQRSSVDRGFLKQIWSLSTPSATMSLHQFYTALRLITMIQNGEIPISKERMIATLNEQLSLPKFTGIDLPAAPKHNAASAHSTAPVTVPTSSAPALANTAVPPAGAHALPPFAMTPQEHLKYHTLFLSYDTNHDGFLSRKELLPLFQKSGMDLPRVDLICQMVDEDKDGQLTSKEFCAAFHIIVCVTKRNHGMPPAVPPALHNFLLNAPVLPPNGGIPVVTPMVSAVVPGVPAVASVPAGPVAVPQVAAFSAPAETGNVSVPLTPAANSSAHHRDGFAEFDASSFASTSSVTAATSTITGFPTVTVSSTTVSSPTTRATLGGSSASAFDAFDDVDHSHPSMAASTATTAATQPAAHDDLFAAPLTAAVTAPTPAPTLSAARASALDFASEFAPLTATAPASSSVSLTASSGTPTLSLSTSVVSNNTAASVDQWTKSAHALVHSQESSLEVQRDVLGSLQQLQQTLSQENLALDASVTRLNDAQAILKAQLAGALEDIERLRIQVSQKRKEVEESTQDNFELQTKFSDAETQRTQLQREIEQLSIQLASPSSSSSATEGFDDWNASPGHKAVHELQTKNALLAKDTSETQRICLQALQSDIRVLQSCKQTLSKQVQVFHAQRQQQKQQQQQLAEANAWRERLATEQGRQVQLQKLHDQQAKEIRRLTEEKQSIVQSLQAQSAALSASSNDNSATQTQVAISDIEESVQTERLLAQNEFVMERAAIDGVVDSSVSSTTLELDKALDRSLSTSQPQPDPQEDSFCYAAFPDSDTAIDMLHPGGSGSSQQPKQDEVEDVFGSGSSSANTDFFGEGASIAADANKTRDVDADDVFGDASAAFAANSSMADESLSSSAFGNDVQAHAEEDLFGASVESSSDPFAAVPASASVESSNGPFGAAPATTSSVATSGFDENDAFGASYTTTASGGFEDPFGAGNDAASTATSDPFAASSLPSNNDNATQVVTASSTSAFEVPDKQAVGAFDVQFNAVAPATGSSDDGFGQFDTQFDAATFDTPASPSKTHPNTTPTAETDVGFAGFDSEDAFATTGSTAVSESGRGGVSSDPFAIPASSSVTSLAEGFGDDDPFFAPSTPATPAVAVSGHNYGEEDPFAAFD
jgi:hypothetical protein